MTEQALSHSDSKLRFRAAIASLVLGTSIMGLKFYAFTRTGSQGIYSDALESIVNVLTASLALFVVVYASKPVDTDHPYGHGKIEYFSSAFEGGLIFLAAFFIVFEAVKRFLGQHEIMNLQEGLWLAGIAAAANFVLALGLMAVGHRANSIALRASGLHILSDVWTTVGVILGLLGVQATGLVQLDLLAATIVGLYLSWTGWKLMREALGGLLDEEDLPALESLAKVFEANITDGIIQIHHTKIIRSGWFHHIDAHLVVPEFWSVERAHTELSVFEKAVIAQYKYKGEANFHLDPCRRSYCSVCAYPNCPVRQAPFEKRMPVLLEHLRSKTEPKGF
jgi:cation diffusion facilitator family transporter